MRIDLKKTLKIILLVFVFMLFFALTIIFWATNPKHRDYFTDQYFIHELGKKPHETLSLSDKFLLFKSYFEVGNAIEATKLSEELVEKSSDLEPYQRVYLAGNLTKLFDALGKHELSFALYDTVFKDKENEQDFYYLFRGDEYLIQKNNVAAKVEFLKAKELTHNPRVVHLVDSSLRKMK